MINRGVIKITNSLWEEIGSPQIFDVHKTLLLPADYEVDKLDFYVDYVEIFVSSEAIPETKGFITTLKLIYTTTYIDGNKEIKLDHIEAVGK